ncbi:hypothetical protein BG015_001872 [Linnemannia schmuckeri]|uniref:Uncharacterized protein n=1 Tax=Linnemannia schmuckeri TaxID=64567 RepID=A0A9P5RSQ6_9FUNG|nr:hypothetical protein BG015_001872 [Linnemannia schmuckeri]
MTLSTPLQDPSKTRRNPVYGDEMEAMQNYNHIDHPAQVLYLRGAQAILPVTLDVSYSSAANKPVQKYPASTTTFRGPHTVRHIKTDLSSAPTKEQPRGANIPEQNPMNTTPALAPLPPKDQLESADRPSQRSRNNSSVPATPPQGTPTTAREGRGKIDKPVKN